jgi:hypothetical protein
MGDHAFELVIGLIIGLMLLVAGLVSIFKRQISFYMRWRPVITLTLTDARAIGFGVACLIGTLITLLPLLWVYSTNDAATINNGIRDLAALAGVIIAATAFGIEYFFEFLHRTREKANRRNNQ